MAEVLSSSGVSNPFHTIDYLNRFVNN